MNDINFTVERMISKIGNRLNNLRSDDLGRKGLTAVQSETILFFHDNGGVTASELKEHLQISHQATRNIIEKLKAKGYLYSTVSKNDARANSVYLTDTGKAMVDTLKHGGKNVGGQLLSNLTEAEKEELLRLLEKTRTNLE